MAKIILAIHVFVLVSSTQAKTPYAALSNPSLEKGKAIHFADSPFMVHISGLNGTLYTENLSQMHDTYRLTISQSYIKEIEAYAFCSSQSLKSLSLDFWENLNPPLLTKEVFQHCNHLEVLELKFDLNTNSSYQMSEDILESFSNLKKLDIFGYKINHLGLGFTKKFPPSLESLFLSYCNIHVIEPNAFEGLTNLEALEMKDNKLSAIPKSLFKSADKLKRLELSSNGIKNLTWGEFRGLTNLEELNLLDNKISSVNAKKIAKNLPNLKVLFLGLNPVYLDQHEMDKLRSKLSSVQIP